MNDLSLSIGELGVTALGGLLAYGTERLPSPIFHAFPSFASRRTVAVGERSNPITVAGPRRIHTGFR
jgi:hypothetical protein